MHKKASKYVPEKYLWGGPGFKLTPVPKKKLIEYHIVCLKIKLSFSKEFYSIIQFSTPTEIVW